MNKETILLRLKQHLYDFFDDGSEIFLEDDLISDYDFNFQEKLDLGYEIESIFQIKLGIVFFELDTIQEIVNYIWEKINDN